jgi:hypothetical protein
MVAACVAWILMIGAGLGILWNYENTPGTAAAAPAIHTAPAREQVSASWLA